MENIEIWWFFNIKISIWNTIKLIIAHSTESALLSIKSDVHLAFAKCEATAVVLLDQSAAFDTIDHDTLLDSLSSWFCVSGVVLDWFKSYLSDRAQCIKIGSILFDAKSYCMVCLKALSWGQFFCHSVLLSWVKSYRIILGLVSSSTLMTHNCICISHIKMCPRLLISCHTA